MLDPRTSAETFADPGDAVSGEAALHTAPPAEAPRRRSEHAGTEFPAWIWGTMIAAYAVFFTGMILATGRDGDTRFVLVISIGFALVYFTCARLLLARCVPGTVLVWDHHEDRDVRAWLGEFVHQSGGWLQAQLEPDC